MTAGTGPRGEVRARRDPKAKECVTNAVTIRRKSWFNEVLMETAEPEMMTRTDGKDCDKSDKDDRDMSANRKDVQMGAPLPVGYFVSYLACASREVSERDVGAPPRPATGTRGRGRLSGANRPPSHIKSPKSFRYSENAQEDDHRRDGFLCFSVSISKFLSNTRNRTESG